MHRNLSRSLRASLLLGSLCATAAFAQSTGPLHPLDGLMTAEYWAAYDVLQQAGHVEPDTFFASVLLREPAKDLVLSWREGMLISRQEMKDVQAPFLGSEMFGADEAIKKDPLVVEALKKRGLTDLNTVHCV